MGRLKFWIKNARDIALPQSAIPCITAIVLSTGSDGFLWPLALPVFLGICSAHLGMNLLDDLCDYRKGIPSNEIRSTLQKEGSVRARIEKCHYILSGQADEKELLKAVCGFLGFAAAMGVIAFAAQWMANGFTAALGVVIYALLGLFFGIEYSGGHLKLGYHGLGELVIGLMFGPLNIMGVQAALTGSLFRADTFIFSIGIGCMVTNIVYVHSVMETAADEKLGKYTLSHLLGSDSARITAIGIFALVPFICLAADILFFGWSPWYLLSLCTLPMSFFLIVSTKRFVKGIPQDDTPAWWMGPMGDWDSFVKAGMDWFLIRWLLARNIVTFFCIVVIIVHITLLIV